MKKINKVFFFGFNNLPSFVCATADKIIKPIEINFENESKKEKEKEKEKENQIKQISSRGFTTIILFENGKAKKYTNNSNLTDSLEIKNIQKISNGEGIGASLTFEGNVFAKGYFINSRFPYRLTNISSLIEDTNDRVIQDIISGANSIYLLTLNQNSYGIGSNEYCQLGFDSISLEKTEKPILMMKNVSKIFSGNCSLSVFLLNSNQELFCCGYNYFGQLGLGKSSRSMTIKNLHKSKIFQKGK
ncbi:regulator of chromosome condensation [Anaeramoeba ignava]|uniref:Regulator of chromosome condensation n=1 Tax=Anaeramoeba ignava TaxID=1746090 RepID=A0A9Q0LA24_ANAIG|nr:regulator of chromosome condensation [Anaeramoeba ignava]